MQGEGMTWVPWMLSGFGILIALISLLRTIVSANHDQSAHLIQDIFQVKERVGLVEMKIGIFWRLVEENLGTLLKKPTHVEMDGLLDKLKAHTLTLEEAQRLRGWLQRIYLDNEATHAHEWLTAILVLAAVESVIQELLRCLP